METLDSLPPDLVITVSSLLHAAKTNNNVETTYHNLYLIIRQFIYKYILQVTSYI